MGLKGKTAVVTGAGSGIGRELARTFAREGAHVVCCGRTLSKLEESAALITAEGGSALAIAVNISDWTQVQDMVQYTQEKYGAIDLLFNNAGSFRCVGPVWEANPQSWTVSFWVSDQCNFRYADPTQARISIEVSKETLTIERITPAIETIADPLYCENNSDCRCLSGSGVPLVGCSNFLYAPLNWSGAYAGDDCVCKAHQCIQKE